MKKVERKISSYIISLPTVRGGPYSSGEAVEWNQIRSIGLLDNFSFQPEAQHTHTHAHAHAHARTHTHTHTRTHTHTQGARCSSIVRAFAHGAMGRGIYPSWWIYVELILVPASASQHIGHLHQDTLRSDCTYLFQRPMFNCESFNTSCSSFLNTPCINSGKRSRSGCDRSSGRSFMLDSLSYFS